MSRLPAVALVLAACGGGAAPAPTRATTAAPQPVEHAEYEIVDRIDALSRALDDGAGSCALLGAQLEAWHAGNRAALPPLIREARSGSNLAPDELGKIEERVEQVLARLVSVVRGCAADPRAQAAYAQVDALLGA